MPSRNAGVRDWLLGVLLTLCCGWAPSRADAAKPQQIVVNGQTPLVVSAKEPAAVQSAAQDLADDIGKVFGAKPRIVHELPGEGATAIVIGKMAGRAGGKAAGPESFTIAARRRSAAGGALLQLSGADMRGTVYAVYQFSQQFLGVDPMYYWTDKEPTHRTELRIAENFRQDYPSPVFRYRGFFINDEDLLTGWAPGEARDGTGIRLEVWNKIFETLLRLKANLVVPGTWIFPNEPQERLATERGLILNQHHAEPLGVNAARWPKGVPYNYSTHPEVLETAWKDAVAAVPAGTEQLWTLGLRGLSDQSYAALDPLANDPKVLGGLIGKAIVAQQSIVRAKFPDAVFATNLWDEGAQLRSQRLLTIPKDVITVWADAGYGYLQDHGRVEAGSGAYFHVAMMNNEANQLTEMVPVARMLAEQARYQKAGATSVFLVNTSDLRPVAMSARAAMQYAWGGAEGADADAYLRQWAAEEFGADAAPAVAAVYEAYYAAPAKQPAALHPGEPAREYGDQIYHTEARMMMLQAILDRPLAVMPDQAPRGTRPFLTGSDNEASLKLAAREQTACAEAAPRWDAVLQAAQAAEAKVNPERKKYYQAEVLTMIEIGREGNRMLLNVSNSVTELHDGKTQEALVAAKDAVAALDALEHAPQLGEYGKWKGWYHGDWLVGVARTRQLTDTFVSTIEDSQTPVPPPLIFNDWEAYFHIMHYEGTRTVQVKALP